MSNRCPDCNTFVPLDEPEWEEQSSEVNDMEVTAEVRGVRNCANCGTEMKEITFELSADIDGCPNEACPSNLDEDDENYKEPEFELDSVDLEGTSRTEDTITTKDANGKEKVKKVPYRYQKSFYGVSAVFHVKCVHCGEEITLDDANEAQASEFEELN